MNQVLEVTGLNKSYKAFSLQDVSFTVPEGCITGFIGANGAGKSTTIKSLLRLIRTEGGSIRFWGMELSEHEQEIKNRLGVVLDEGAFYESLTMREMKSILAPAYSRWSDADYRQYMERFRLDPKQKISTLSKGMKAKFALVLALSHNADLLIMDEPTSGLDPLVRREVMDILLDFMKQEGKSVFLSTHITSDLDRIADLLILIDSGKIVFQRDKDELLDKHKLVKGGSLTPEQRALFLSLREGGYGYEGISRDAEQVRRACPDAVIERATVEEIMLAYLGGAQQ